MGAAYYAEFEKNVAGYDPAVEVSGKTVARAMDSLDEICQRLKIASLLSFYSESMEETFSKIGEPAPPGMEDKPIQSSEPKEGLKTISALMEYLVHHPNEVTPSAELRDELEAFRGVFKKASEYKTRFRLCIDI